MRKLLFLTVLALVATAVVIGCNKDSDTSHGSTVDKAMTRAADAAQDMQASATKSITDYVANAKDKLETAAKTLKELESRKAALGTQGAAMLDKPLSTLKDNYQAASDKISALKDMSPDQWSDAKPEVDKALVNLASAQDKALSLLK